MTPEILIGTEGWDHESWVGEFYPEELPREWRFCYYSNKMRAVLVPYTAWSVIDAGALAEWGADSDAAFRLVLELPLELSAATDATSARAAATAFLSALTPLAGQIAGCVARCDVVPVAAATLTYVVEAIGAHYPLCLQLPRARQPAIEEYAQHAGLGTTWDADRDALPAYGGNLLVARSAGGDPRALRAVLEKIAQAGARQGALFIKPSPQAMKFALQARDLAEMMGI